MNLWAGSIKFRLVCVRPRFNPQRILSLAYAKLCAPRITPSTEHSSPEGRYGNSFDDPVAQWYTFLADTHYTQVRIPASQYLQNAKYIFEQLRNAVEAKQTHQNTF